MKRYAIWNKQDEIIVPTGQVFTAEQWMERYPMFALSRITAVCAAGEINGAYAGTLGQMVQMYEAQGADFSACETDEDKLAVIEAFEDAMNAPSTEVSNEELTATSLASIAASMEFQNMMSLPDEEV